MNQRAALAVGALAGAAAAFLLGRKRPGPAPGGRMPADPRADELRKQLAEARQAGVDEGEFAAAGMGAETILT
jgi:hypothetical protein